MFLIIGFVVVTLCVVGSYAAMGGKLAITGHTGSDESKKGRSDRSNWELSIRRANSARRALKSNGIPDRRVRTVDGKADTDLLDVDVPTSPRNRRIAVLVLREAKKLTQQELAQDRIFKLPDQ